MMKRQRYRMEEGRACIDIRLHSPRQLFDLRDPAPFRERDLDPGAVEHLLVSVREIPIRQPVRINLHITPDGADVIEKQVIADAIRAHFEHEIELVDGAIAKNFRNGRYLFVLGVIVLTLFLTVSKLCAEWQALGFAREVLSEGLVITGWVAMWRPAEVLLYDWWPLYEQKRWIKKLVDADLDIDIVARTLSPLAPASTAPIGASLKPIDPA